MGLGHEILHHEYVVEFKELTGCSHDGQHISYLLSRLEIHAESLFSGNDPRTDIRETVEDFSEVSRLGFRAGVKLEVIPLFRVAHRARRQECSPQIRLAAALGLDDPFVDPVTDEVHALLDHQYPGLPQDLFAPVFRSDGKDVVAVFLQGISLFHPDTDIHRKVVSDQCLIVSYDSQI